MKVHAHPRDRRASPSRTPTSNGSAIEALGRRDRRATWRRRRAPDDGRRADVRVDRRHGRRGVEHAALGPDEARLAGDAAPPAAPSASRPARCCTTARANGIPANRCRAGRSAATGARTASRSGDDAALIADDEERLRLTARRRAAVRRARWRDRLGVDAELASSRPTKMPGTTCGRNAGCRSTSIRSSRSSRTSRGARAAGAAFSSRAWTRSSAMRCRCSALQRRSASAGHSGAVVPARGAAVPDPGRFADGLSPAARFAAVGRAGGLASIVELDPMRCRIPLPALEALRRRMAPLPDRRLPRRRRRPRRGRLAAKPASRATAATARPATASPPTASSAPPCASSRATGGCTSSCRRSSALEDYLDLVAAVEDTAAELAMPVVIEGYTPPHDPRLQHAQGHARSRRDRGQYAAGARLGRTGRRTRRRSTKKRGSRGWARRSSCSTAATPAPAAATTSSSAARRRGQPVLRRPDLLRSLVAYWQNHPSLSYLFSGLFIGPTSQAPRVDEARNDSLYELEIAFRAVAGMRAQRRRGSSIASSAICWSTSTGNTHRAEFCIDKLYLARQQQRPARPGRDARLRDAAARADEPGAAAAAARPGRPVLERALSTRRWCAGARQLHDRFMLPHFVWQDFRRRPRRPARRRAIPFELTGSRRTSSSASRCSASVDAARRRARTAPGARAVARARRRAGRRRHGALRRFVGRAPASQSARHDRQRATSSPCNGRACRCIRPARRANTSPASATAPGSRRTACIRRSASMRRSSSTSSTPGTARSLGGCTYHVAHPGRPQLRHASRSTPTKPRAAASPRFFALGHTPGRCSGAAGRAQSASFRSRSTCGDAWIVRRGRMIRPCRPAARDSAILMAACAGYAPLAGAYDEMMDAAGELRAALASRSDALTRRAGPRGARARAGRSARRLITRTASPTTSTAIRRAWTGRGTSTRSRCVISPRRVGTRSRPAWSQRARLLDCVLADLYGPQRCCATGCSRRMLVFANPASCGRATARRPRRPPSSHLYAADLVRRRAGSLRVLDDRTAGAVRRRLRAGESRIVLARLPEAFRAMPRCARLAPFFRRCATLLAHGAAPHDATRASCCSRLARYQRHLLRARLPGAVPRLHAGRRRRPDGARRRVSFKTLGGPAAGRRDPAPRRRRLLRSARAAADSVLGVAGPGRGRARGNVAIANPLGTGLLETPAHAAVPPPAVPRMLGEELQLPSVRPGGAARPTRSPSSLGQPRRLVIMPALPEADSEPIFVGMLEAAERDGAGARIRAQPALRGAGAVDALDQRRPGATKLAPAALVLRAFLAATATDIGDAGRPGARAGRRHCASSSRCQLNGGGSKDAWVLADRPVSVAARRGPSARRARARRRRPAEPRRRQPLSGSAATSSAATTTPAAAALHGLPGPRTGAVSPREAVELRLLGPRR